MPPRVTAAEPPQTVEAVAAALEVYLADHPRAFVLEDGKALFAMGEAKYTLATEHGRCTLHLWSEERNLVRRVSSAVLRNGVLRLSTHRFGQTKPQTLELVPDRDRRTPSTREAARVKYLRLLERVMPHERRWLAPDGQMLADLSHSLLNKGVVQMIIVVTTLTGLGRAMGATRETCPPARRSYATTSAIVADTSWPYAPTFWIGVAPAEPGMPARHSMPASPAVTVRATASDQFSPAASSSRVPSRAAPRVASRIAVPSNPASAITRLLPPPTISTGSPRRSAARTASTASWSVRAVTSRAAGPPSRSVVRGASGEFSVTCTDSP